MPAVVDERLVDLAEVALLRPCGDYGGQPSLLAPLVAKAGAGGGTRTRMSLTSLDFESSAYANFATPAWNGAGVIAGRPRRFNVEILSPNTN